ncbi:two-component sensor histidine kinase [Bacteroides sp. AM07-16]|nr:two-component sensor histidine kinase [Bacteroides sp. AM07-16]
MEERNLYLKGILLAFCLFLLNANDACGAEESLELRSKQRQDSLLVISRETKDADKKISSLSALAQLDWGTPMEPFYLKSILTVAEKADSIKAYYDALSSLGRYYCNLNHLDSLTYWSNVVDSMANVRRETPAVKFDFLKYYCRYYLVNGDYELAMNEAVMLQMLAGEKENRLGLISSNEYLGLIYLLIGRDSDAVVAFEKSLELLATYNWPEYELQIIPYLLIAYFNLQDLTRLKLTLAHSEILLHKIETTGMIEEKNYPFQSKQYLLYAHYLNLYVAEKNLPKAREMVNLIPSCLDDKIRPDVTSVCYLAMSRYYSFIRDYPEALREIDKALAVDYSPEPLKLKVDILKASGKKEEALKLYAELLSLVEQTNVKAFTRQLNQLRMLHDLNDKKMQEQKLLYQKQQLSEKQVQLTASVILSCVLLVLLYILFHYFNRTRRLKNDLQLEQEVLIDTSKSLRIAKEQAEESNRLKTSFIANISHEIRTPLNAIVGFADLLQDADETDRNEYLKIIKDNTDMLLGLVSDVLDLSRLEADSFSIKLEDCDLTECCQSAQERVRHRVQPGVKLTFTASEDHFILKTDGLRLQQLLNNLLSNAVKFTEHGEVNLNCYIDRENRHVVFSVTDTGCGIPSDRQKDIFNRFVKVNEFIPGAGLGLPICCTIAARLCGTLTIDPAYDQGARFVFVHPFGE